MITLDGESGFIYAGSVPTVAERPELALEEVRRWRAASEHPYAGAHALISQEVL